jgi:hypothetical protein
LKRELSVETAGEAAIWPRKPRANIGFPANPCKLTQFSTSQIVGFVGIPPFVHYPQNLWKMNTTQGKRMGLQVNPKDEFAAVETWKGMWATC